MPLHLKPNSEAWLTALAKIDPGQAAHARQIIKSAGSIEICSICGDSPSQDYQLVGIKLDEDAVATIRLCKDCLTIRRNTQGEEFIPFSSGTDSSKN
jgi:hypothetical protein